MYTRKLPPKLCADECQGTSLRVTVRPAKATYVIWESAGGPHLADEVIALLRGGLGWVVEVRD